MRMGWTRGCGAFVLALAVAAPAVSGAVDQSPRPVARADVQGPAPKVVQPDLQLSQSQPAVMVPLSVTSDVLVNAARSGAKPALRPMLRPKAEQVILAAARPDSLAFLGPDTSPYPWARPDSVVQKALFGKRKKRKGSVCGDLEIQGEKVGKVPGRINGCGIKDAVRIKSVSGVMLSQQSVMSCSTAQALNTWVEKSVKPTFRRRGPVVELKVAAHYACRTRNNRPGARISEHGKGKAIDISGFKMADGEMITVQEGWRRGTTRALLEKVWKQACGPFGTVLGPRADRYHSDHFHLDVASYRSGPYCK